jgi:hypothetical protein
VTGLMQEDFGIAGRFFVKRVSLVDGWILIPLWPSGHGRLNFCFLN